MNYFHILIVSIGIDLLLMNTLQMPTRVHAKLLGVSLYDTYASMTMQSSWVGRSNGLNMWGLSNAKAGSQNKSLPGKLQGIIPATKTTEGISGHINNSYEVCVCKGTQKPVVMDNAPKRIAVTPKKPTGMAYAGRVATR